MLLFKMNLRSKLFQTSLTCSFLCPRIMVINLEQKKVYFDLRFILTYNIYMCVYLHVQCVDYIPFFLGKVQGQEAGPV